MKPDHGTHVIRSQNQGRAVTTCCKKRCDFFQVQKKTRIAAWVNKIENDFFIGSIVTILGHHRWLSA